MYVFGSRASEKQKTTIDYAPKNIKYSRLFAEHFTDAEVEPRTITSSVPKSRGAAIGVNPKLGTARGMG